MVTLQSSSARSLGQFMAEASAVLHCRTKPGVEAATYKQDYMFSRRFRKASAVLTTSSAKWFQSTKALTKNDCPYCSVRLEGTWKHFALLVTCEYRMLLVITCDHWRTSDGLEASCQTFLRQFWVTKMSFRTVRSRIFYKQAVRYIPRITAVWLQRRKIN